MPNIAVMPFQREFILSKARFLTFFAGRGAGKTHAIQTRAKLLTTSQKKFRYMYVTPLSVQGDEVYEEMNSDSVFHKFIKKFKARPYPKIMLKNGSRIWFRSFQRPEGLRSTGEDEICVDESQDDAITEKAVENVLKPIVSRVLSYDGRRGRLILAGQFRGDDWRKLNYFDPGQEFILDRDTGLPTSERNEHAKLYVKDYDVQGALCPLFASWRAPSSYGFRYQGPGGRAELAMQKDNCPLAAWEQEWECLPRANINAAFDPQDVDACSTKRNPPISAWSMNTPWNGGPTIGGVDIAETVDRTAVVIMDGRQNVIYCEQMPHSQKHAVSAKRAAQICAHFKAIMVVDATGGALGGQLGDQTEYVKLYRAAAHERALDFKMFYFSGKNKNRIIGGLLLALQQNATAIPATGCEDLLKQMKEYEYVYIASQKFYKYGAPTGKHDDLCSALLIAHEHHRFAQAGGGYRGML